MEGIPKLPGVESTQRHKTKYTVSQTLSYKNGYMVSMKPTTGIGGEPLKDAAPSSEGDSVMYDPVLTYGRVKHPPVVPFRPKYVIYDKVALTFRAFFKQGIPESMTEHFRVRYCNIIYFMEDDTITVMEPVVVNCGFPQGRLVRRGKIPKRNGDYITWRDLNVGIDIDFHGIVLHITDCDEFTKEFLAAQGIELNEIECMPIDPVTSNRIINSISKTYKTPLNDDKLRRYLEYNGKVLVFDCVLDETDIPFGELMTYKIMYFLEDDTVAVRELRENQEGRDHFPMLLKRTRLPKIWKKMPVDYPSCYLERSDAEVEEYYQPKDLIIGETIFVFGRKFLLLDCDVFTRKYYSEILHIPQKTKLEIKRPQKPIPKRDLPKYLGLGTPEDSLGSCMGLLPKPPKKDIIRYVLNSNKFLRFGCVLDNAHPEDDIRKFILKISLGDGMISINEPPIRNSGIIGGKFLSPQLVVKPGSNPDQPEYYTTKDFVIGQIVTINCHRFKIVSADLYVYKYMKEHPELFSPDAIDGVRNYCLLNGDLKNELKAAMQKECEEYQKEKVESEPEPEQSLLDTCLENIEKNRTPFVEDEPQGDMRLVCDPVDVEAMEAIILGEDKTPPPPVNKHFLGDLCKENDQKELEALNQQKKKVSFADQCNSGD